PIDQIWAGEFAEEKRVIAFERQFLQRLAIFNPQFHAAGFGLGQNFFQRLFCAFQEWLLFCLALFSHFSAERFVFGRLLFASGRHVQQFIGVILHLDAAAVENDDRRV